MQFMCIKDEYGQKAEKIRHKTSNIAQKYSSYVLFFLLSAKKSKKYAYLTAFWMHLTLLYTCCTTIYTLFTAPKTCTWKIWRNNDKNAYNI